MSDRLDEIEARAKAVADEPRCTDCGREVILHNMLCGDCGVDAICRDAGDDVPMRERHASARYVDDVAWLVAQVRERDAEIARLREALDRARGTMDRVLECPGAAVRAECGHCSDALASGCADVAALLATVREAPDA